MKSYDLKHKMNSQKPPEAMDGYYPTLHLTIEDFPPLKGKKIGDVCRFEAVAHVTGMSETEHGANYTLEIRKATPIKPGENPGPKKAEGY